MNSRQRAQLRAMANGIDPVFQVGKGGINEQLIKQVVDALEKRELIKLTVLETAPFDAKEAANDIAEKAKAEVVQVIGRKIVFYKPSRENKKIVLVK